MGVLSVLVLVALFIPRAQVTLKPVSKTQSIILPVTASPSVESVFISGSIPAHEMRTVVEGEHTIAVTGEGHHRPVEGEGCCAFRNLTQQAVTVPGGHSGSFGGR